jgi:methyl-accepting chemotaxis protein
MSIRNLSIRDKLFWLSVLALAFVIAVAATGYWGVEKLQASSHEMRNTFSALRNALEADMMHDAIRGDVLTIFRATSLNDSKPHDDAVQALKDHVTRFNTAIAKNEALPLDSNIKEALVQVKPRLIEYIARGENIAKLAKSDAIAANALYPEFEQSFLKLEVELEKVSDLLKASNDHFVGNTNSVAAGASGTLLTVTLISILALLALSILLGRQITRSLAEALGMAERIASGHLDDRSTDARNNDEAGQLIASMNKMRRALFDIVGQVRSGATTVYRATDQINEGNENLSRRTEQQAATLEETAASTEQLAASVRENTSDAREANQRAAHASDAAVRGGQITRDAVKTMAEISDSAKKIAEIISLIEGIAFQTNILALNAAIRGAGLRSSRRKCGRLRIVAPMRQKKLNN